VAGAGDEPQLPPQLARLRQDHNGFSHQNPGFLALVVNKKAEIVRVYLPPGANTLQPVTDHCLRSRNYVNVVVAGKQSAPQ
jgi:xylulose-5-phosphate/fructose-6-phosphate phosphoketolase